ncbi:uncharacterized protein LOC131675368 isoform X2 [Phymastichus coffea]|uniref:uncharacterized protein LOC131675368 isoform X2 n=1 Tax=Phymastichus coffea TaxID=108790 RepID=UPI00273CCCBA|nr:uncharacterized protein LOC131675368 isoform X2 [Phymastichus coffea]
MNANCKSSTKSNQQNILLGTIAFVNHDCNPNVEFVTCEKHMVYLTSLREIKKGEELLVFYGNNYFGYGNESCECVTCKINNSKTNNENGDSVNEVVSLNDFGFKKSCLTSDSSQYNCFTIVTSTIEDMNEFHGFSYYVQLDKKLNRAYIKLERMDLSIIQLYKAKPNNSAFCIYCEDFKIKFPRHLRFYHSNQDIVKNYVNHEDQNIKNSALSFLRNQGSAHYQNLQA